MFGYEIWCEGTCYRSNYEGFDDECDAYAEADVLICDLIEEWNDSNYDFDDFEIIIKEL